MKKLFRSLVIVIMTALVLSSCGFPSSTPATEVPLLIIQPTASIAELVGIELAVLPDTSIPFTTVGQVIQYKYNIKAIKNNTSGPSIITVTGTTVTCPAVTTVGNLDDRLDQDETIVCTSTYPITQADLDKGSVVSIATASMYGVNSNQVTTTVATAASSVLKLAKTANPTTFDTVGQIITYTYVITNSGATPLGPAQFTVTDAGITSPINCGEANLTLASNATVTCSATYAVTQADIDKASVATNATAAGGGVGPSQPANVTVTKNTTFQTNPTTGATLTPGTNATHQVVNGEWLWQIARCYGVDPAKLIAANPQLGNPAKISPGININVPNIGSAGKIYKTSTNSCVASHTVQTGDTWASIALKYNADATVLQMVNSNNLTIGRALIVPLNSANGTPVSSSTNVYCVDISRPLKLANINSNTTHFNVCGTPDTSTTGNMTVGSIKIYQRSEDVGLGGFTQDLTVPANILTSTPIKDAISFIIADMTYDGNDDFRFIRNVPAGPNMPYVYYIFDPATNKFVYSEAFGKITSPEFPGNSEVRSQWRENAVKWGVDTYTITNNAPKQTKRETWEALNATQAKHQVIVFNADGTSSITVDDTVPLPIQ